MKARKRFAQHFLEPAWVRKVAAAVGLKPGEAVLEVGAGRGALTHALAASGAEITAIELDRDLVAELGPTLPPNVTLVEGDVLALDLAAAARGAQVRAAMKAGGAAADALPSVRLAGNLPYNISTPLIARLVTTARDTALFKDATVMVQLEVANRLCGPPGTADYGPLAILAQTWADASLILRLPPGAFRPPPKVESAVVRLVFRQPLFELPDVPLYDAMVRAMFVLRRKTLANALQSFAQLHGLRAEGVLEQAGIDSRRRPQTLTLAELANLARTFAARRRGRALPPTT